MTIDSLLKHPERYLTYSGEIVLKSRSHEPETVEFYIEPDPDGHAFGKHKAGSFEFGDRFFAVIFEINASGDPVDQEMKLHLERALSSSIRNSNRNKWVQSAGAICRDTRFYRFLKWKIMRMTPGDKKSFALTLPPKLTDQGIEVLGSPDAEEFATNYVRYYCNIRSRSELGLNRDATQKFSRLRREFLTYCFDEVIDGESLQGNA